MTPLDLLTLTADRLVAALAEQSLACSSQLDAGREYSAVLGELCRAVVATHAGAPQSAEADRALNRKIARAKVEITKADDQLRQANERVRLAEIEYNHALALMPEPA